MVREINTHSGEGMYRGDRHMTVLRELTGQEPSNQSEERLKSLNPSKRRCCGACVETQLPSSDIERGWPGPGNKNMRIEDDGM